MISRVDSNPWSPPDLTGNSALVVVGQDLVLVGGRRADGTQAVYRSNSYGAQWSVVCTIPAPQGTMDPMVALDTLGLLHIVVGRPNSVLPGHFDLVERTLDLTTYVLSDPVILIIGSKTMSAYDVVTLADGVLVVATALEPVAPAGLNGTYALLAFEIAPGGAFTVTPLATNHWAKGDTFGSVSLLANNPIELFYTSHARGFTFKPTKVSILTQVHLGAGVWGLASEVTSYEAQHTDDKLTVVSIGGGAKVLVQSYYLMSSAYGLQSCILYGVFCPDSVTHVLSWVWSSLLADAFHSCREPVVGTDGVDSFLLYLRCPKLPSGRSYSTIGSLVVTKFLDGFQNLAPVTGAWQTLEYRWLRGTKYPMDLLSQWSAIGVAGDPASATGTGPVTYLSHYNLAPVPSLAPTMLTLQRGIPTILDASATVDPDLDSLTYTWTHDHVDTLHIHVTPNGSGDTAILLVDKTIGPAATAFTVSMKVTDGTLGHERELSCSVTVPFNAEPAVSVPALVPVLRNSSVDIEATTTDVDADDLMYTWQQLQGTPVTLVNAGSSKVTVNAYRMHPDGEDIVLRVIVQDGVNRPVFADTTLRVSAIVPENTDLIALAKSYYTVAGIRANITQRQTLNGAWSIPQVSELLSDLRKLEIVVNSYGRARFCYTSGHTLQAISQGDVPVFYRSLALPVPGTFVLDSTYDELDRAYLLADNGVLYRYETPGPGGCSDWPDNEIPLLDLVQSHFTHLNAHPLVADKRILSLYGSDGVLLIQVQDRDFRVINTLQIDRASGILPSNAVQFLRMDGVSGLNSGQLLVGLEDVNGGSVELLVSLATRRSVASWDRFNTFSSLVHTGEILAPLTDALNGTPDPPIWLPPEQVQSHTYQLSWTQSRPDLVVGYEIWLGLDAAPPVILTAVTGGSTRKAIVTTKNAHTYHLTVRSQGSIEMSPFSDEFTIQT